MSASEIKIDGELYEVVIGRDMDNGGYSIECPTVPGSFAHGDTVKEAMENVEKAIRDKMEVRRRFMSKERQWQP